MNRIESLQKRIAIRNGKMPNQKFLKPAVKFYSGKKYFDKWGQMWVGKFKNGIPMVWNKNNEEGVWDNGRGLMC